MSFAHPWLLLLLALPVGWAAWEWNRTYRRTGLLIKAAVFALILLALSEPRWSTWAFSSPTTTPTTTASTGTPAYFRRSRGRPSISQAWGLHRGRLGHRPLSAACAYFASATSPKSRFVVS